MNKERTVKISVLHATERQVLRYSSLATKMATLLSLAIESGGLNDEQMSAASALVEQSESVKAAVSLPASDARLIAQYLSHTYPRFQAFIEENFRIEPTEAELLVALLEA